MRRLKNYSLAGDREEPFLTYRDRSGKHTVSLNAGGMYDAEVEVFRDGETTYVLSYNPRFRYVGLETFVGTERQGELFLHGQKALEDVLGQSGLELTPLRIAKRLLPHVLALPKRKEQTPPSQSPPPRDTRTFEIHLEDLTEEARKEYLAFVGGEPAHGPLAIIELADEKDEEEDGIPF